MGIPAIVAFDILSNDYSKRGVPLAAWTLLQTRIPKFGRDFAYHYPSCDLYFVWGKLRDIQTQSGARQAPQLPSHRCCGKVECWDPRVRSRVRSRVGMLDCAQSSVTEGTKVEGLPSVSALKFNGSHHGCGNQPCQVLLYDLRASHPLLVKDHYYGLPIKSVNFQDHIDLVLIADSKIIKIWNKDQGKVFSPIEPQTNINDVCIYPDSGMLFTANEDPKMNTFSIPALGPAPRWCSFLDNLTEELKESPESTIYDDYKFVTRKDLENLGLSPRGIYCGPTCTASSWTSDCTIRVVCLLQVKTMANPFAYDEYRKDKIRQKIGIQDAESTIQVLLRPKVNKELALKLMEERDNEEELSARKKGKVGANTPAHTLGFHMLLRDRNTTLLDQDSTQNQAQGRKRGQKPQFFQIKVDEEFRSFGDVARKQKLQKASLEEHYGTLNVADTAVGSKHLTFTLKKSEQQQRRQQAERDHHEDRKTLRRSAGHLSSERVQTD
nr:nucleolar protein 10-like [Oncorhynchus nerka]